VDILCSVFPGVFHLTIIGFILYQKIIFGKKKSDAGKYILYGEILKKSYKTHENHFSGLVFGRTGPEKWLPLVPS